MKCHTIASYISCKGAFFWFLFKDVNVKDLIFRNFNACGKIGRTGTGGEDFS